jgi:AraC-like DNA-binding protein
MLLQDFLPTPQNRDIVRLYRIVHFSFDSNFKVPVKKYPPRPEHVLSFFPRGVEKADQSGKPLPTLRCILMGQFDLVINRAPSPDFLVLQIVFQPAGFFQLTGVPGNELRNQYLDGEIFFSNDVRLVNEQLFHACSYFHMINILDQFVQSLRRRKANGHGSIDEVSKLMLRKDGNVSLDWLARQASLSIRQFERNFQGATGVTPRLFSRISRFDKAFRMRNQFPELDWLSIAIACGYYDYQHLVKDYKGFTGVGPTTFHILESKAPERLFGLLEGISKE